MEGWAWRVKPLAEVGFDLSKGLVGGNSHRCCKIQGTQRLFVETWEMDAMLITNFLMQPIGTAMSFIAKKQGITGLEFGIPVGFTGMGGEQPDALWEIIAVPECFP